MGGVAYARIAKLDTQIIIGLKSCAYAEVFVIAFGCSLIVLIKLLGLNVY